MRRFSFGGKPAAPVSPVTPWENSPTLSAPVASGNSPSTPTTPTFQRMFGRRGIYGERMAASSDPPTAVDEPPIQPLVMNNSVAARLAKRTAMLDKRANVHFRRASQPFTQLEHTNSPQHHSSAEQHQTTPTNPCPPTLHTPTLPEPPASNPLQYRPQFQRLKHSQPSIEQLPPQHFHQTAQHRLVPLAELEGDTPRLAELEGDQPKMAELQGSTPTGARTAITARVIPAGTVRTVKVTARRVSQRLFESFRPEKTHYSVECSNAAEEVKQAETDARERKFVAEQINACRLHEKKTALTLDEDLHDHAQHHADNLPSRADSVVASPSGPSFYVASTSPALPKPDTVTNVPSPLDRRSIAARIVSDRGLGAMACVERWYSGKHKQHRHGIDPERHQEDCPCRLHLVYETMMYEGYTKIGVGRATEGPSVWVVELAP